MTVGVMSQVGLESQYLIYDDATEETENRGLLLFQLMTARHEAACLSVKRQHCRGTGSAQCPPVPASVTPSHHSSVQAGRDGSGHWRKDWTVTPVPSVQPGHAVVGPHREQNLSSDGSSGASVLKHLTKSSLIHVLCSLIFCINVVV